jgi:predicted dehydrogenase
MSEEKKLKTVNSYKVAIIGAGRIGAFFDSPEKDEILTHAHAYLKHPDTELVGFVDVNEEAGEKAAKMWGGKYYSDIESLFKDNDGQIDILSVCTPDKFHAEVVKKVLDSNSGYSVKLIILEKPVAETSEEAKELAKLSEEKGVPILVNYIRRFDPVMHHVRENIVKGEYGKVLGGRGLYAKGLRYSGSHLVDLMQFLFGEVKKATSFHSIVDYKEEDPSISANFVLDNCPQFTLMAGDERACDLYEFDIILEKARIRFVESGFKFEMYEVTEDDIYPGFFDMKRASEVKTELDRACLHLVEHAVRHLQSGEDLWCSIAEASLTQQICEGIQNNHKENI